MLFSKPDWEDWAFAREVHLKFAAKPGASHIASAFALAHLSALLRQQTITSVMEFGSGIGTITYLLLRRLPPGVRIVCAERDEWCRGQFEANLPPRERGRIELLPYGRPKVEEIFDLVIIDGPTNTQNCGLGSGSLCFFEGTRTDTRNAIAQNLTEAGLHIDFRGYFNDAGRWQLRWAVTRFGFSRPQLARKRKGCWMGQPGELQHPTQINRPPTWRRNSGRHRPGHASAHALARQQCPGRCLGAAPTKDVGRSSPGG
jgi:hypothetical protein